MVELRDFVAESLKQIIDGIVVAQEYAKEKKATVNPAGLYQAQGHYQVDKEDPEGYASIPQFVDFDLALTVSEGQEAKAGIGIFAAAIGAGTQAKVEGVNTTVSRMKFSVPLLFPSQIPN